MQVGVCLLAADKRGKRNVFQAGSAEGLALDEEGRCCCCEDQQLWGRWGVEGARWGSVRALRRTLTFSEDLA